MSYVLVTLVTALNCVALFFLSFLAVGGDGSAHGIHRVWQFGYPWIATFALVAFVQCARGQRSLGVGIAASTLPAGYVAAIVGMIAWSARDSTKPSSPEFLAACKTAGPHYMAKPVTKVDSIAYDWAPNTYPPSINYFNVDARGNVSSLRGGLPRFGAPIDFIEGRCCQYEGRPSNGVGPFVRHPRSGEYFGIPELTADALVTYSVSYADAAGVKSALKIVDVAVSDRRDGKPLATLRYVLDHEQRRACGTVSEGVLDEQAFIRRAVAVD
jgi:hypothetical protein